ncbi:type I-E CRISPR-associated protein Cas6/Cse3/CasE [Streptomyces sp. NPDC007346]|uniref:type I-E CRISPR-associated protein Cas6/Cse3/CasE n=1 Tax=Streptomyces sp. NPDC007346 TaxID=3154682 RepID=UPI0034540FC4
MLYQFAPSKDRILRPAEMQRQIRSRLPEDITQADTGPRVLWRREGDGVIQVQYPVRPRPSWLLPGSLTLPQVLDMRVLLEMLAPGQLWAFDLAANTVRRGRGGEYAVSPDEWLTGQHAEGAHAPAACEATTSRATRSGFRVLAQIAGAQRRGTTGMSQEARIRGVLEVEDVEALQAALEEGIGRGKAQGLGMLSLSYPPRKGQGR